MAEKLTSISGEGAPASLESALAGLEGILRRMEEGELPLDLLVEEYEKGVRLVAYCQEQIEASSKKIELLTRHLDGALSTEPFDPASD